MFAVASSSCPFQKNSKKHLELSAPSSPGDGLPLVSAIAHEVKLVVRSDSFLELGYKYLAVTIRLRL